MFRLVEDVLRLGRWRKKSCADVHGFLVFSLRMSAEWEFKYLTYYLIVARDASTRLTLIKPRPKSCAS
jgi:hypothetical protein